MRLGRWPSLALVAFVLPLVLPLAPARPTTVERLELVDLVARAERVAWGECVSARPEWDETHTRIYTRVSFAPREMLKGSFQSTFEMKLPGGELDGYVYVIHGMPRFTQGMEAIVHVTAPHPRSGLVTPVGLAQGVFTIERPAGGQPMATRDTRELDLVAPGVRDAAAGDLQHVPVDELLARIRAEVARQRQQGGR